MKETRTEWDEGLMIMLMLDSWEGRKRNGCNGEEREPRLACKPWALARIELASMASLVRTVGACSGSYRLR
jgi:hypothetical protein